MILIKRKWNKGTRSRRTRAAESLYSKWYQNNPPSSFEHHPWSMKNESKRRDACVWCARELSVLPHRLDSQLFLRSSRMLSYTRLYEHKSNHSENGMPCGHCMTLSGTYVELMGQEVGAQWAAGAHHTRSSASDPITMLHCCFQNLPQNWMSPLFYCCILCIIDQTKMYECPESSRRRWAIGGAVPKTNCATWHACSDPSKDGLRAVGIRHLHLLPCYEGRRWRRFFCPWFPLYVFPASSSQQQPGSGVELCALI